MTYRKLLICLSLLALMAMPALAQDQTSQTPSAQPQASQPQSSKDQTAQPQSTQPSPGSTTSPAPAPPADTSADTSESSSAGSNPAPSGPPPIQEPDPSKVKHDGGENDVDAIGNRKIGGRGLGDWYSLETEIKMGKQYAMMVENSVKLVPDPVVNEYVNRIGQNLVRNSDAKVPFTIRSSTPTK